MLRAFFAGVLVASLAVNAVLLIRRSSTHPQICPQTTAQSAPISLLAAPSSLRGRVGFGHLEPSTRGVIPDAAASPLAAAAIIDNSLQQSVLCTIAEEKMQERWRSERETTAENLRRSFADSAEQERNVQENAAKLGAQLGLDATEQALFSDRYREKRIARIDEANRALLSTPPDYEGLLHAAQGLFADEDVLAKKFAGESGREQLRAGELESRTAIMAIAASMADVPLSAVRW